MKTAGLRKAFLLGMDPEVLDVLQQWAGERDRAAPAAEAAGPAQGEG